MRVNLLGKKIQIGIISKKAIIYSLIGGMTIGGASGYFLYKYREGETTIEEYLGSDMLNENDNKLWKQLEREFLTKSFKTEIFDKSQMSIKKNGGEELKKLCKSQKSQRFNKFIYKWLWNDTFDDIRNACILTIEQKIPLQKRMKLNLPGGGLEWNNKYVRLTHGNDRIARKIKKTAIENHLNKNDQIELLKSFCRYAYQKPYVKGSLLSEEAIFYCVKEF